MGRPAKTGIKFYRMDSGHIINKKVRLLCNDLGSDGYFIWCCLLDYAYGKWGYYFDTNDSDEMELFSSDYAKKDITLVNRVIAACIKRQLFEKDIHEKDGILTSYMMQEVFLYATSERRRQKKSAPVEMDGNWLLLDFSEGLPDKLKILHVNNAIFHVNNSQTRQDNTETKTKGEGEIHTPNFSTKLIDGKNTIEEGMPGAKFQPPVFKEVDSFFLTKATIYWDNSKCNQVAQKFFNHYKGLGWKTTAGASVKDWQALANKWILDDLQKDRTANKSVTQRTHSKRNGTANDNKTIPFIESIYKEFIAGIIKEIAIPAGIYVELVDREQLLLSNEQKGNILNQCNGDEQMAKKKAVAEYFTRLIKDGKECVFQSTRTDSLPA